MKQFSKIFKFELSNYFKNKLFVGITIFLVLAVAVTMFAPRIGEFFKGNDDGSQEELPLMLVLCDEEISAELVKATFSETFINYDVQISRESIDSIKEKIKSGEAECAFVMNGLTSYTYYVNNISMYDMNTSLADEVLKTVFRMNAMINGGLSEEEANRILSMQIESTVEKLGKDQAQNFMYTYIMIFALYMVILLYGQMVAMNVANEKSSRAMELLITSAKPTSMMFGKVFASCTAGLIQMIAIFGSSLLFYNVNKSYWKDNLLVKSIFDMPVELFIYMLVFFILGFFIYAFLFGAVGSTVSKLEDINTAVMPITTVFIIGFFVVIFSMSSGNVDSVLMKICSYIPFTSPMAMFTRLAMSVVPVYETIISILILVLSVFGIGYLSAKIYRVGVLLYGNKPSIKTLLSSLKNK